MSRAAAHPDPAPLRLSNEGAAASSGHEARTKRQRPPLPGGLTPLLSKQQLAAWLNVSLRTIDRWEAEGLLPEPAINVNAGRTGRACKRWDPVAVARKLHG